MTTHLRVDPIACDGHGNCHELLPELIDVDRWGYPMIDGRAVPPSLAREARRAVTMCPKLALTLERRRPSSQSSGPAG
jgi:ferredoxin